MRDTIMYESWVIPDSCSYEMFAPPDGQYGMVLPDNTVNGQLLQLEKGVDCHFSLKHD